jgi:hypothetical protein
VLEPKCFFLTPHSSAVIFIARLVHSSPLASSTTKDSVTQLNFFLLSIHSSSSCCVWLVCFHMGIDGLRKLFNVHCFPYSPRVSDTISGSSIFTWESLRQTLHSKCVLSFVPLSTSGVVHSQPGAWSDVTAGQVYMQLNLFVSIVNTLFHPGRNKETQYRAIQKEGNTFTCL